MEKIRVPDQAKKIMEILRTHGFEAYVVGGCVRDSLLGRKPEDWDITTNAMPRQIKGLFARTVDTGIEHGTVTVLADGEGFEVTTYRIDGEYEDGRHPKAVLFTGRLADDLKRRDFTINAMAYNEQDGLVDCFDGLSDLRAGIIRCVGCPEERFTEDALRILRCLRFGAQLGFKIEESTRQAVIALAPNLRKISAERIQAEWNRLIGSPYPERMQEAYDYGVLQQFWPEVVMDAALVRGVCMVNADPAREASLENARAAQEDGVKNTNPAKKACAEKAEGKAARKRLRYMRYAMMFRRLPAETAYDCLRRLKFDNETIRNVTGLVKYLPVVPEPTEESVRRAVCETGETLFAMLPTVWRACCGEHDDAYLERLERVEVLYARIKKRGDCISPRMLAVSGTDLIALGMKPGRELGDVLKRLLNHVLAHPEDNRKERLLGLAQKTAALE